MFSFRRTRPSKAYAATSRALHIAVWTKNAIYVFADHLFEWPLLEHLSQSYL